MALTFTGKVMVSQQALRAVTLRDVGKYPDPEKVNWGVGEVDTGGPGEGEKFHSWDIIGL
jgi:hypothetical protein